MMARCIKKKTLEQRQPCFYHCHRPRGKMFFFFLQFVSVVLRLFTNILGITLVLRQKNV